MKDKLEEFLTELIGFDEYREYSFKKCHGMTFVFRSTFIKLNDEISSAEIKPVGIIYEENDEIYFAPLDKVDKIEPIVEEFVKHYMD